MSNKYVEEEYYKEATKNLTENDIYNLKSVYSGLCTNCGKNMTAFDVSNDGNICVTCYFENENKED